MKRMKKLAAVSVLSVVLLFPGISQASEMSGTGSGMMMQDDQMTKQNTMMQDDQMMNTMQMTDYVPLRIFAETLGYKLKWSNKDQSVTLTYVGLDMDMSMSMMMSDTTEMMSDMYTIKITPNSKDIMVGADKKMLEHAPMVMSGKTYVSKDFIVTYLLAPFMMKSMQ